MRTFFKILGFVFTVLVTVLLAAVYFFMPVCAGYSIDTVIYIYSKEGPIYVFVAVFIYIMMALLTGGLRIWYLIDEAIEHHYPIRNHW